MQDEKRDISPTIKQVDTILNLLTKFPFAQIKEKVLIFFCDGFKLRSGVFHEDSEVKELVYLIEINYFDESLLANEQVIQSLVNGEKSTNPYVLERKGIYYDSDLNLMYLIYKGNNKKLFIEESSLKFLQQEENKTLLKLQVFYNYCQIVKIEHSNKREMSIIHPFLLFSDNNTIYTIDHAFTLLKPCINHYSNFSILYYFGIFDFDLIEKLEISKNEKTELYFRPDILLLCALLVYLYRPMITNSSFNFDLILLEISKDFTYKDKGKKLPKLLSLVKENDIIKRTCSSVLSIDYNEISDIERLIKQFVKHFANIPLIGFQCNCDISLLFKESNPMLNLICINCGSVQCPKCEKKADHSCQNDKNKIIRIKEKMKLEYDAKNIRFVNIQEVREKKIIQLFSDTIKKIYAEFEDKNNVSFRKIRMIEQFIENFTNYIEQRIKTYDETKFDVLKREIQLLKDTGNFNLKSNHIVTSNKFYQKLSKKNIQHIDDEHFNLKNKWGMLSQEIDDFSLFLKDSSEMLNVLLYDRSIQQITEVAKARMVDFQNLINDDFFSKYKTSVKELIKTVVQVYTNNGANPILPDNILNEYQLDDLDTTEKFYYKKYFVFYSNSLSLFDVKTKTEKEIKLELSEGDTSRPINISVIGKNYRYLHMKTGIMITGGKGMKKVYFIYYSEIKDNAHLIKQLPDLGTVHEKHMMLSFNIFNIIVIGGIDNCTCEMFNFAFRKWESLPSLHSPRFDACVFLFNYQYVYVFGGMRDLEVFSTNIEVLDMNNLEGKWVIKQFVYGENALQCFRLCGIKKADDDSKSIYIFGGETTTENTLEEIEIMQKFSFETNTLEIVNQNSKPYSYEECLLLEIGPNEYNI